MSIAVLRTRLNTDHLGSFVELPHSKREHLATNLNVQLVTPTSFKITYKQRL